MLSNQAHGGIGDVNSDERGAGARYNVGKPPLDLLPAWVVSVVGLWHRDWRKPMTVPGFLEFLANWQEGRVTAVACVRHLTLNDLEDAARVLDYGRRKYAAWNWAKGMPWSVPLGCAQRHAFAILRGEEVDSESGLSHRGHLVCNVIMMAQFERTYPEGDDRPTKWLSTDASEAPSGGLGPQAESDSPQESGIELEQPKCFDPESRFEVVEEEMTFEEFLAYVQELLKRP